MYTSMNQASNGGDFIKTEGDFNANMDYTAERRAYEHAKRAHDVYTRAHCSIAAAAPEMQQLKDMRARNSDLSSKSAEKDRRKSKTLGRIGCSPENVIPKQHQACNTLENNPDIGPDTRYTYQSVQSPPQLYFTAHPVQEGASYKTVKKEPHKDPP